MTDITLYLLLLLALAAFWIWELWLSHREKRVQVRNRHADISDAGLLAINEEEPHMLLRLTEADAPADGLRELHSLTPGDQLAFMRRQEDGEFGYTVFSNGRMIGSLQFEDSVMVESLMSRRRVTGMYVYRQNCYGNCGYTDLEIILYYTPEIVRNAGGDPGIGADTRLYGITDLAGYTQN